jgi:hypothetical protein
MWQLRTSAAPLLQLATALRLLLQDLAVVAAAAAAAAEGVCVCVFNSSVSSG